MSPAADNAAIPVVAAKTMGEALRVQARYVRASWTATPDASGNARARSGMNAGQTSVTAEPRHEGEAEREDERATSPGAIFGADVAPDPRDRPDLERHEDAPERPLDRPGHLHRGERRLRVMTEHRAVHDEDHRLEQGAADRRERNPAHLLSHRAEREESPGRASTRALARVRRAANPGDVRARRLTRAGSPTPRGRGSVSGRACSPRRPRSSGSTRTSRSSAPRPPPRHGADSCRAPSPRHERGRRRLGRGARRRGGGR